MRSLLIAGLDTTGRCPYNSTALKIFEFSVPDLREIDTTPTYLSMSSVLNLSRNEDLAMMSISQKRCALYDIVYYFMLCHLSITFTSSEYKIYTIDRVDTAIVHVAARQSCTTKYQVGKIPEWFLLGHENFILTAYLMKRKIPIVYIFIYKHINLSVLFELDSQRRGGVRIEGNLQGIRDSPSSQSWIMNS